MHTFFGREEVTKTEHNHYQMPLPLRDENSIPPNNKQDENSIPPNNKVMAIEWLKCLVKRFKRDPSHFERYVKVMQGLLANGYAETVDA